MSDDPDLLHQEIMRLHAVNDRLRLAINRLAMQDATLSVCDGNVTVTMDATLTDAEREAVTACAEICESQARSAGEGQSLDAAERWSKKAATLRGLLERTGGQR